mmetsp:Transcript_29780/g.76897  ORF Transcript_29780/g.76897 Transcript_29780/m.76897 type:complete len:150 (-) Transcript_29780:795-1244(-)
MEQQGLVGLRPAQPNIVRLQCRVCSVQSSNCSSCTESLFVSMGVWCLRVGAYMRDEKSETAGGRRWTSKETKQREEREGKRTRQNRKRAHLALETSNICINVTTPNNIGQIHVHISYMAIFKKQTNIKHQTHLHNSVQYPSSKTFCRTV